MEVKINAKEISDLHEEHKKIITILSSINSNLEKISDELKRENSLFHPDFLAGLAIIALVTTLIAMPRVKTLLEIGSYLALIVIGLSLIFYRSLRKILSKKIS